MTEQPKDVESADNGAKVDRRTILKGAAAGLAVPAAVETASAHENTIVLEAGERPTKVRIEVDERIKKGGEAGRTDRIVRDRVAISVMKKTDDIDDRTDDFVFSGRIIDFDVLEGTLEGVWINGDRVNTADLGKSGAPEIAIVEDFEAGRWPGDWQGETHGYRITRTALAGTFSVEADGSIGWPNVRKSSARTSRGHTYAVQTAPGSQEAFPTLLTNVQGLGSIMDDCYAAWLRTGDNELLLQVRRGGNGTDLERVRTRRPLKSGSEYVIALDVAREWVRAHAIASDGAVLATTDRHRDTTHAGGTLGLYTGGASDVVGGTRYDQLTRR